MNTMSRSVLAILLALLSTACAQADTRFPSYLSAQYCEEISMDFMTRAMGSLQRYREKQLTERHRGGMNNIRNYLAQRQAWLQECDQYLNASTEHRIFRDDTTTEGIFAAIESVTEELGSLISGVTYSLNPGEEPTDVVADKFDRLFLLVDNHKTRMLLKGQFARR